MKKIVIIGATCVISEALSYHYSIETHSVDIIATAEVLGESPYPEDDSVNVKASLRAADIIIICTDGLKSGAVFKVLKDDGLMERHTKVIDMSPMFRLDPEWTYGLPELGDDQEEIIASSKLVANPGCFATSAILLLRPLMLVDEYLTHCDFYLDGVGGSSTGGRRMIANFRHTMCAESVYSLHKEHLHIPEIKAFCDITGDLIFTPKIVNELRGIRMMVYVPRDPKYVLDIYKEYYKNSKTTSLLDNIESYIRFNDFEDYKEFPGMAFLRVYPKARGSLLVCTLDNMGKGAISSALANINLMLGERDVRNSKADKTD